MLLQFLKKFKMAYTEFFDIQRMGEKQHQCIYCNKFSLTSETFCHPLRTSEIMCRKCCETLPICIGCERHIQQLNELKNDNLLFCNVCSTLKPVEKKEASVLLDEALNFLTSVTQLNFKTILKPHISIELKSPAAMERHIAVHCEQIKSIAISSVPFYPNNIYGLCCWEPFRTKKLKICILNKLESTLFGAFLCHELIHAMFFLLRELNKKRKFPFPYNNYYPQPINTPPPASHYIKIDTDKVSVNLLEEGLCHCAAACWLKHYLEKKLVFSSLPLDMIQLHQNLSPTVFQAKFWIRKCFYGKSPEFSIGFRWAIMAIKQMGWINTIQNLL